jgi:hypothetical protein
MPANSNLPCLVSCSLPSILGNLMQRVKMCRHCPQCLRDRFLRTVKLPICSSRYLSIIVHRSNELILPLLLPPTQAPLVLFALPQPFRPDAVGFTLHVQERALARQSQTGLRLRYNLRPTCRPIFPHSKTIRWPSRSNCKKEQRCRSVF